MNPDIQKEVQDRSLLENARTAINAIVRPPRNDYAASQITNIDLPNGLPSVQPIPLSLVNRHGEEIIGTLYKSVNFECEQRHCCVLYLHGNIGSQMEGRFLVRHLCPRSVSVFCFDFSGSGHSGGEFVTLGYHEHDDVVDVVDLLANGFGFSDFALWGRSMGAASAVMAAPESDKIKGIIVDSAYSSLEDLFASISSQIALPGLLKSIGIWWIKREVQSIAGFDCDLVRPLDAAARARVPLMLGHSSDDSFVPFAQGASIFASYACADKEMMALPGGHNSVRDAGWVMKCVRFILRVFGMDFQYIEVEVSSEAVQHVSSFGELLKSQQ